MRERDGGGKTYLELMEDHVGHGDEIDRDVNPNEESL